VVWIDPYLCPVFNLTALAHGLQTALAVPNKEFVCGAINTVVKDFGTTYEEGSHPSELSFAFLCFPPEALQLLCWQQLQRLHTQGQGKIPSVCCIKTCSDTTQF